MWGVQWQSFRTHMNSNRRGLCCDLSVFCFSQVSCIYSWKSMHEIRWLKIGVAFFTSPGLQMDVELPAAMLHLSWGKWASQNGQSNRWEDSYGWERRRIIYSLETVRSQVREWVPSRWGKSTCKLMEHSDGSCRILRGAPESSGHDASFSSIYLSQFNGLR